VGGSQHRARHAAAVSAAEEQALRRVHEHQRVARLQEDPRKELRRAQQGLEAAEARVTELESQVARVVAALEIRPLHATRRRLRAQSWVRSSRH